MHDEDLLDRIEDASSAAESAYLAALIEEARAIVAGTTDACPRSDHLWALLSWLDGHCPPSMGLPPNDCLPF